MVTSHRLALGVLAGIDLPENTIGVAVAADAKWLRSVIAVLPSEERRTPMLAIAPS
jgi:hypothetical protein